MPDAKVATDSKRRGSQPGERRGGRQKGVPNKVNQLLQQRVAESGITPLNAMLEVMRDTHADMRAVRKKMKATKVAATKTDLKAELRTLQDDVVRYADKAAPYVHNRLQAVLLGNKPDEVFKSNVTHTLDKASAELIASLVK